MTAKDYVDGLTNLEARAELLALLAAIESGSRGALRKVVERIEAKAYGEVCV